MEEYPALYIANGVRMNVGYTDVMKVITHVKNFDNERIAEIKATIQYVKEFDDQRIAKIKAIIQSKKNREHIRKIWRIREEYNTKSSFRFNIFEAISDKYRRENLHSDILKDILSPQTPTIGNEKYVRSFIKLLGKIASKGSADLNIPEFSSSIFVEREKDYIDIFIYDNEKNSIIIESKINNAKDQPNQLPRYYKKTTDDGYKVHAIVYLILSPGRKPKYDYYEEYLPLKNTIQNKTRVLCGINKEGKKSLAHSFLDPIIAELPAEQEQETARVFISHYSDLLKRLGGEMVTESDREELFKELFLNGENAEENIGLVEEIAELWRYKEAQK